MSKQCDNCHKDICDCKLASKHYDRGYQQGRSDKYQEITSEYMLLTEKQVAEIRANERANIIERMYVIYNSKTSRGKHYIEEFVKQIERDFAIN